MKTALLALLALTLLSIPFAHATTPITVTGTFTASFTVLSVTSSDGNTIIRVTEIATLSGFFTGTRIAQGSEVIHPDGTFNAYDTGIFTGTANGVAGTLVITGESNGIGGTGSGDFIVGQGADGLSGVHAQGPFQFTATGPTSTTGTYSVQFHADPWENSLTLKLGLPIFFLQLPEEFERSIFSKIP